MKKYAVQVFDDGLVKWFLDGKLHREDGPAVTHSDGYKAYFFHGKRHREDGPAVIHSDGGELYYLHDKSHREDGPAVIHPGGGEAYYLHGKLLSKEEWEKKRKPSSCEGKIVEIEGKKYRLTEVKE